MTLTEQRLADLADSRQRIKELQGKIMAGCHGSILSDLLGSEYKRCWALQHPAETNAVTLAETFIIMEAKRGVAGNA